MAGSTDIQRGQGREEHHKPSMIYFFFPKHEIQSRHVVARHDMGSERKNPLGQSLDAVRVVAQDLSQGELLDLVQLGQGEANGGVVPLVPEPIPIPQGAPLLAENASESRADRTARDVPLHDSAHEQVDVVRVLVELVEFRDTAGGHHGLEFSQVFEGPQAADFPENVVAWHAMLSATLDVDGGEVTDVIHVSLQFFGYCFGKESKNANKMLALATWRTLRNAEHK